MNNLDDEIVEQWLSDIVQELYRNGILAMGPTPCHNFLDGKYWLIVISDRTFALPRESTRKEIRLECWMHGLVKLCHEASKRSEDGPTIIDTYRSYTGNFHDPEITEEIMKNIVNWYNVTPNQVFSGLLSPT